MKWINKISWFLVLLLLNSCTNSADTKKEYNPESGTLLKREFLNLKLTDTITVPKKNGKVCLNKNLDTLTRMSDLYELRMVDLNNYIELIHWHPFIGNLEVKKINSAKYEFIGKINLPNNGNWNKGFSEYSIIKYQIEFKELNYILSKTNLDTGIKFDRDLLNVLKASLNKDKDCFDQDWEIANNCFKVIEEYEYQLFAALINNKYEFKKEYLSLRNRISIVNAGQFSEYLEGNYFILALLGIITEREYDLSKLLYNFNKELTTEYCY